MSSLVNTHGRRPRIFVVVKRSYYRKYIEEEHDARVEALIAAGDPSVSRLLPSHADHEETLQEVRTVLEEIGADATFEQNSGRAIMPSADLVVTVGGDGTLLAASHQLGPETPLLGINSAPNHSVGFFCAARKGAVRETIIRAVRGDLPRVSLSRMCVELNGACLHKRVLNEALYCHASPAATSRYILRVTKPDGAFEEEEQKSSGIWVGPAAGSTAAQKSAGGNVLPFDSTDLQFVVREPYTPEGEPIRKVVGLISEGGSLVLRSRMRQAKIFLDGEQSIYDVTIGDVVTMSRSDEPLTVLGLATARKIG